MAKRFRNQITAVAEADILAIRAYIARDNPLAAAKWARRVTRLIRSLRYLPFRYEMIPEELGLETEYRHIVFGNYRIIFSVRGDSVFVERVFHAARLLDLRHLEVND